MEKLVVANMKMNILSLMEREQYLKSFKRELGAKKLNNCQIVLCPPAIHLEAFRKKLAARIAIGAQDVFWERSGSFTGEISPAMVKNFGGEYVILGHSERRKYFGENAKQVNLKIIEALKLGLKPILCVGEDADQKRDGAKVFLDNLEQVLDGVSPARLENITICYEPAWAISSNNPDSLPPVNEIMGARLLIKKFLVEKYGLRAADKVRIIYGGSVDAANAKYTCVEPGMAGALVGKASLAPHDFIKIAEIINS